MRYVSKRFLDFFRPGQEIPAGHYDAETLARLIEKGQVEAVADEVEEPPVKKPARRTKKST